MIEVSDLADMVETLVHERCSFPNDIVTGVGREADPPRRPSGTQSSFFEPTVPEASLQKS